MIIYLDKNNADAYLPDIARVHYQAYSSRHFTSCFSGEMLRRYYSLLISNSDVSLVSVSDDGRLNGFVISGVGVGSGVTAFVKKHRVYLVFLLLKNPAFLYEKLRFFLSSRLSKKILSKKVTPFRLMSIAVDPSSQSKGVGATMIENLESKLSSIDVLSYGLSVRKENCRAIDFYRRNGFLTEKETADSIYFFKELYFNV